MDAKIYSITAREILDSRGNPTVETTVILNSGYRGTASVPSGVSVGKYEAVELRDGDPARFGGLGVLKAVANVNGEINEKLKGKDALDQGTIDKTLVELDGTPNKIRLGANALLSVSLAIAVSAANHTRQPLYQYLHAWASAGFEPFPMTKIPSPIFNTVEGGKHGTGNLNFQEFQVIAATNKSFRDALLIGTTVHHEVKQLLRSKNLVYAVGDEGGFTPDFSTNMDVLKLLSEAVRGTYKLGLDVFFGLDIAASTFKTDRGYHIKDRPNPYSTDEFIRYLRDMRGTYNLLLLEDLIDEDDWEGWKKAAAELGTDTLIIGDDLLATNPTRLSRAISEKACSAILLKPNQIGSLSEFLAVVVLAKKNGIKTIVSHRAGETNDAFIADLAVAVQSDYVKFGAPVRGERVAKYNRLLAIESELKL